MVGPSGSGKSTLASLIARFNDPTTGSISLGGTDLRDMDPNNLYQTVGFVFQDTGLVSGTAWENIALADVNADIDSVRAAAKAAQIHQRIEAMPAGYQTEFGPEPPLSGGEKQRVAIARALLADTPVLVLDEATAFADPESEYQVQMAINRLTAGRTVVVIAHRLQTVAGVDRIVVMDAGKIVEVGSHSELIELGGKYAKMWGSSNHLPEEMGSGND